MPADQGDERKPLVGRLLRVRWLVRAPIWLYRARLGFLFGSRALMLEHIGRNSGLRRYVVLEVVSQRGPDRCVIVSGFGPSAQWFQNVLAHPQVRVSVGLRYRVPAEARQLGAEGAKTVLAGYAARHPKLWKTLEPVLDASMEESDDAGLPQVPVVELHLQR
ncbi:nitroreductase family deazaflavin-dependent oxidoreductase [Phytoactinopolyspora halotolerans]|uniref:Nitroreductase family deazaflavin-dependent oxidoreductase n=1 Tax=Phytoactinopolyspora halotolerans TaxID=1981512 RepID=A0A6L9SC22_9ACTN|nr:nitroreductase family deazaflavin-dependent oxidoreductase [Phytoactinopolyspora halotolerans]NEE02088.1 nitroreductase family deazaflavin-dependent oxidoreductase [Phytoactinopolyspora halotolerans]